MQFVEGSSLDRLIRELRKADENAALARRPASRDRGRAVAPPGPRPPCPLRRDDWKAFARIGLLVALALDYAHRRGVLHNDVKPANLLLDRRGQVVVTDFGIARRVGDGSAVDRDHAPPGTLRYMAPERLAGACDARSDVYSLGATLYELITRLPAFDATDSRDLIEQIVRMAPVRPRRVVRQIPRPLERIVVQALSKDPRLRYSSARSLAADLLRFINGERVPARPTGWLRRWF